jgi:transcriptional regulator with XRE-family HTH domain
VAAVARVDGDRLARAREAAGLSQAALAQMIGASSKQRVWQWERGAEQPRPKYVPELAKALNVDPLELLDGDPDQATISALRIAAGLTRDDVWQQAAIAKMTYNRIDRGVGKRAPAPSIVHSLAEVLDVSDDTLLAAIERARQAPS